VYENILVLYLFKRKVIIQRTSYSLKTFLLHIFTKLALSSSSLNQ